MIALVENFPSQKSSFQSMPACWHDNNIHYLLQVQWVFHRTGHSPINNINKLISSWQQHGDAQMKLSQHWKITFQLWFFIICNHLKHKKLLVVHALLRQSLNSAILLKFKKNINKLKTRQGSINQYSGVVWVIWSGEAGRAGLGWAHLQLGLGTTPLNLKTTT